MSECRLPYGCLPALAKDTFDMEGVVVAAEGEKFVHIMVLRVCTQCSREQRMLITFPLHRWFL